MNTSLIYPLTSVVLKTFPSKERVVFSAGTQVEYIKELLRGTKFKRAKRGWTNALRSYIKELAARATKERLQVPFDPGYLVCGCF